MLPITLGAALAHARRQDLLEQAAHSRLVRAAVPARRTRQAPNWWCALARALGRPAARPSCITEPA
jgi:hypothetical protein